MRRLLPQGTRLQRSPQLERGVGLSLVALLGPSRSIGYELGFRSEPRGGGRAARAPIGVSLSRAREQCPWQFALLGCHSVQETRRPVLVTPTTPQRSVLAPPRNLAGSLSKCSLHPLE